MTIVGTDTVQTPRVDAVPKVTGQAVYTEDLPLSPGTLYGAILRSPYVHARLVSIDAQRAERLPGVHAVVTREHLGNLNPFLDPASYGAQGEGAAPLIALEKVRYEGEPVAAVAAETPALAQHALECIEVEYEDLPVIFDTREALQPDAPVMHDKRPGNLVGRFDFGWGDIEQGFREADHIFEDTYVFQSVFHHPMENLGGCIAEVRGDTLEITAPIQHPFRCRDDIAAMFGFDRNQVRVRFPYVGGGFGSKELKTEHLIAILLAIRAGRAVTLRPTAEESFRSDCRHAVVYHVKTGVKADGTLVAQDIDLLFDKGVYAHGNGMNVPRRGSSLAWGPYRVSHLRVVGRAYYTNKVPAGAFRSLGRAQTTWGYESHYDTIARQLGIDPVAFRRHNFLQRGERLIETVGPFDTDMDDLVRRAMAALGWDGRSQHVGPHADAVYTGTTPVRGRGIATTFRHGYSGTSVSDVEVTADNRGIIRILHTGAEIGQGLYTMLARVASVTLGIPESQIEVTHPNTDLPYSDGIGSSRDTVSMGMATQRACEDLKQQLVANVRVRNVGTIGGNLCFGDPHSDPAPALLVYDTRVKIGKHSGDRTIGLEAFYIGLFETAIRPDEILIALQVEPLPPGVGSAYLRAARFERPSLGVAVAAAQHDGRLANVQLAVSCVGPVPMRLQELESRIAGATLAEAQQIVRQAQRRYEEVLQPVDDLHGSAAYKTYLLDRSAPRTSTDPGRGRQWEALRWSKPYTCGTQCQFPSR